MKKIIFLFLVSLSLVNITAGQSKICKISVDVVFAANTEKSKFCCIVVPENLKLCFCNKMIKILEEADTEAQANENDCGWKLTKAKTDEGTYKVTFELIGERRNAMMIVKALKKSTTITQTVDIKELE